MIEICASLLAANHAHIARDAAAVESCGINRFHFDVCDGHYTQNIIFGDQLVREMRNVSNSYFDVHLAVYHMESILGSFIDCGADMINLQYESCEDLKGCMERVHTHAMDVSLCIVPGTSIEELMPYFDKIEAINVLAVNPGIGGQEFQPRVLRKLEQLAALKEQNGYTWKISVDGGVNTQTLADVIDAGADIAIMGSGMFAGSLEENIEKINNIMQQRRHE